MSKHLVDYAPGTGVFTGDLAYGRCEGEIPNKHGDYSGEHNKPIAPLTLAPTRDPECWRKDPLLKEAKKRTSNHQSIKTEYLASLDRMRANIHLVVGKQRI